ncbi:50S ribosomal protein L24 [Nitrosomonas sp.]|uniref:50S ribosomal protein L24 n=1 Tax=Nitrosomonas sp. TaxID=42353 RepID=UPI001D90A3E9|nr:50S ribosomal protein L24 [Nitrosomonas sp.]MBX3616440.1 50S ribosomal protein L24 [Nitrosomonas sp.]
MSKIKKGDEIIVITGKDKGKKGAVLRVIKSDQLIVQGVNTVKKHQKPNPATGVTGGIIDQEMPVHISNVAIYNFKINKSDKIKISINSEKRKTRIFKSTGELIG